MVKLGKFYCPGKTSPGYWLAGKKLEDGSRTALEALFYNRR